MRYSFWLGVVQLLTPEAQPLDPPSLLTAALTLSGLAVMVYRLGAWRQEVSNTTQRLGAEIARCRDESNTHFASIERRFDAIDLHIAAATEQRVATERWQAKADTTLDNHDCELGAVSSRVTRLEGSARDGATRPARLSLPNQE